MRQIGSIQNVFELIWEKKKGGEPPRVCSRPYMAQQAWGGWLTSAHDERSKWAEPNAALRCKKRRKKRGFILSESRIIRTKIHVVADRAQRRSRGHDG